MDTQKFLLGFVKIVERHPVLYNAKLPDRTPHLCSLTWEQVAEAVRNELHTDCAVDELKTKWKGIRSSFSRFKRKMERSNKMCSKQYYLYDSLQFLHEHTTHRSSFPETEKPEGYQSSEADEWDSQMSIQIMSEDANGDNRISSGSPTQAMPVHRLLFSEVKIEPTDEDLEDVTDDNQFLSDKDHKLKRKEVTDIFEATTTKVQKTEENSDIQFFRSILPDIDHFTASEKRKFKIGVLKLIDDIENSREYDQGNEKE